MTRSYAYVGGQRLAIQDKTDSAAEQVGWVHQDPVTKSQRFIDSAGALLSQRIDLDPWGAETNRTVDPLAPQQQATHRFTTYERDANGTDEAMHRRYNSVRTRFEQPDPSDGSYNLADPQSFNRYSYVQNDPVNFTDPSGLEDYDVIYVYTMESVLWAGGGGGSGFEAKVEKNGWADTLQKFLWRSLKEKLPKKSVGKKPQTSECANHRARLLGDPRNRRALDEAWTRTQAGTNSAHEEGGLLGQVIDEGQPWQKDVQIDQSYSSPSGSPRGSLEGFTLWAQKQITNNKGSVGYDYWYHTHPFQKGMHDPVDPTKIYGNPNGPSGNDGSISGILGLTGVIVSKTSIIVYDSSGTIKCSFRR